MLSIRNVTTSLAAITALVALSGCSGDDSSPESSNNESEATGRVTPSETPTKRPVRESDCQADVELTGAIKASWSGEATAKRGGYEKFTSYTTSNGDVTVSVLPAAKGVPATPVVTKGGETFTVQPKTGKVKVDKKGGGAEIDAKAVRTTGGKTRTVAIKATFDC